MSLTTSAPCLSARSHFLVSQFTFDEFIGTGSIISPSCTIDGNDSDYKPLWDFGIDPAFWGAAVWSDQCYSVRQLRDYDPFGTFILVYDDHKPIGFYTDGQCWIEDGEHRGKKLSTPLILAACALFGGRPYADDTVGFCEAGWAAHASAYRHAIQAAFVENLIDLPLRNRLLLTSPQSA